MSKETLEVLLRMQECLHELRQDVDRLDDDQGIQIGNSTFDYMDKAIESLKEKFEKGD